MSTGLVKKALPAWLSPPLVSSSLVPFRAAEPFNVRVLVEPAKPAEKSMRADWLVVVAVTTLEYSELPRLLKPRMRK